MMSSSNDIEKTPSPDNAHPCISLIVPCYNEEASIPVFYNEVIQILTKINKQSELIFIDDGSKDSTLKILRQLADQDARVHYISFSRNFGKEAAMLAGLQAAQGDFIVMLDADLQHPPSLIPQMLEETTNGEYDCVVAKRTRKGDPPLRSFFARCFYRIISKFSGIEFTDGAGDFRLMTKAYVAAILQLDERNRFSKGIYPWIGFKTKWIEYENVERIAGETKWSFTKLFFYSLDGIIAFSTKLLSFVSLIGFISFFMSIVLGLFYVIQWVFFDTPADGWATIVCLIVFFSGIVLLSIGILGQYIAKIYTEVKHRPQYIIREAR